jgi:hypothetical protein
VCDRSAAGAEKGFVDPLHHLQLTRNPEGIILYEAQARPADHKKVHGDTDVPGSFLGM